MPAVSIGTPVDTVNARDPDVGSAIRYSIDPGSITAKDKSGKPVQSTFPVDYMVSITAY